MELCREPNCDGPALVYSGMRLQDGRYRRYHRCAICGVKFKTFAVQTHENGDEDFSEWLDENVGRPPTQLTALALFDGTLAIWLAAGEGEF